jgi:hypothetical protein
MMPGFWRCDAVIDVEQLVATPAVAGPPLPPAAPRARTSRRCGTVYPYSPAEDGVLCRCGLPSVGECSECERAVCGEHSDLWRGWRVCDRDLAKGRMKSRAAAIEEDRRIQEAAAAAEAERQRLRTTLLELTPEEAIELLYVEETHTEQEIRSAVHVLRSLPPAQFTELCLYALPYLSPPSRTRRSGLHRLAGWAFAGPDYHNRSWFLTAKGEWYRSGSYGTSGAEDGHRGKKVRFDDTEKRAVIYEMSWQQSIDSGVA